MEQLPVTPPQHLPISLSTAQLPQRIAEFRRIVRARAIAQVLEKIDRELTEALVDPLLRQGAPPEAVAAAEEQVAAVTEVVHQSLQRRQRPRRPPRSTPLTPQPVRTAITSGQWKAPKAEPRLTFK
jgi:hypothetical protein